MVYLLLAGFATPLVLSVHSVVSWDFAMTQLPGWHSTIFAPYFVCGAIFSGCALVLTLVIPVRKLMKIEGLVTIWHLDNLSKVVLLTSLIMTYSYVTESFMVWYTQDPIEMATFHQRYYGPQGYLFWMMVFCNCVVPLLLFSPARPHEHDVAVHHLDFRQYRDVAGAIRASFAGSLATNHRSVPMAFLRAAADRNRHHGRQFRLVPDEFLIICQVHADCLDDRNEGGDHLAQAGGTRALPLSEGSMSAEMQWYQLSPTTKIARERSRRCTAPKCTTSAPIAPSRARR